MKIGIDARFYGPEGKGLGRYTQRLLEGLEKQDSSHEYRVFLRRENFNLYRPQKKNFQKVLADVPWYSWKEQAILPALLAKEQCDIVHFLHFNAPLFYRGKFLLTLHDLILFHYPTLRNTTRPAPLYWVKYLAYRVHLAQVLRRASVLLTVSHFTKRDILQSFPSLSEEKILVLYEAADALEKGPLPHDFSKKTLEKYGILQPYLLYVGNAYPHKNLPFLLRVFARFEQQEKKRGRPWQLVIVGKDDFFYQRLRKEHQSLLRRSTVLFLPTVSDKELAALYRHAFAFLFLSLYEGFGLPPLEAMRYGVPVLSSSAASLPEILGDAALYTSPFHEEEALAALEKIVHDHSLRKRLVRSGKKQVERYSWDRMAQETLRIYDSLCHDQR